jgi:ABC-type sugar transport system ATPase subunit
MNGGKLLAFDTPEDLYDRPKTLFIAGFVGNPPMNFVNVAVAQSDGSFVAQNHALQVAVPTERGEKAAAHRGQVVLGIRPEDITVTSDGEIMGEVAIVEPLGRDDLLDVRVGDHSLLVLADPAQKIRMGDSVRLRLGTDRLQFFDPQTERSLLWSENS